MALGHTGILYQRTEKVMQNERDETKNVLKVVFLMSFRVTAGERGLETAGSELFMVLVKIYSLRNYFLSSGIDPSDYGLMSLRVKSRGWSFWLSRIALGVVLIWLAFACDNVVQRTMFSSGDNQAVHPLKTGAMAALAHGLSKYGDWPYLLGLGGVIVLALFLFRKYRASRMLTLILIAGMLAGFSCTLVRSTVCRTRPTAQHAQGFYGPRLDSQWIVGKYEFGAFPSGHTATAMGLAAAIWMFSRRWALLMGFVGVAIAWSRIALGCHHFSDVVAATVWGFLVAPAVVLLLNPIFTRLWRKLFSGWTKEDAGWDEAIPADSLLSPRKVRLS